MRIAFIAMRGCPADAQPDASMPNLALLTLAGMTPAEHTLQYFDLASADGFAAHIDDFD